MMRKFKRGDLVKTACAAHHATTDAAAAGAAVDQYWYAYYDKSIGMVVKADADRVWVRWFGAHSDNASHTYRNKAKYFELVSQIDRKHDV